MLALLLKMDIPLKRKLIYFAIGTFGTVSINVIRIISLSLYALVVTTNVREWEAFHSVAGEIMFLPWLFIYLFIVLFLERKMRKTVGVALSGVVGYHSDLLPNEKDATTSNETNAGTRTKASSQPTSTATVSPEAGRRTSTQRLLEGSPERAS